MRPSSLGTALVVLFAILLAGCTEGEDHADHMADRWTFTQRSTAEDLVNLTSTIEAFNGSAELNAAPNARQLGGQWHGALAGGRTIVLRINASADMNVEWRAKSGPTSTSGRCDWGPEGDTKDVSLGSARMSNTTRACEIQFTPTIDLADPSEPTLRWEARTTKAEPEGWMLRFEASSE